LRGGACLAGEGKGFRRGGGSHVLAVDLELARSHVQTHRALVRVARLGHRLMKGATRG
jgi:hypothetical protein